MPETFDSYLLTGRAASRVHSILIGPAEYSCVSAEVRMHKELGNTSVIIFDEAREREIVFSFFGRYLQSTETFFCLSDGIEINGVYTKPYSLSTTYDTKTKVLSWKNNKPPIKETIVNEAKKIYRSTVNEMTKAHQSLREHLSSHNLESACLSTRVLTYQRSPHS